MALALISQNQALKIHKLILGKLNPGCVIKRGIIKVFVSNEQATYSTSKHEQFDHYEVQIVGGSSVSLFVNNGRCYKL